MAGPGCSVPGFRSGPRGCIPDEQFSELFARLGSHRDRALVAFWVSTGARASELLGATAGDAEPGRQLITVIRKGTRAMQQLPASPDAFVWLRLYQEQMRGLVPAGPDQPLWWTLRRPFRQLAYHAALRMFTRAGEALGKDWTLHDLRHTAAYRMARDPEMPLADIQWILGHARLSTTQLYLTPVPDDVIACGDRVPRPPGAAGAAAPRSRRLPAGHAAGPVRDGPVSGTAPAGLASSFLFTRVPSRPCRPGGRAGDAAVPAQAMPRPVAGDRSWTGSRRRALLRPRRSGWAAGAGSGSGPRSLGQVLDWLAGSPAAPGRNAGRPRGAGQAGPAGGRSPPLAYRGGQGSRRRLAGAAAWEPGCSC